MRCSVVAFLFGSHDERVFVVFVVGVVQCDHGERGTVVPHCFVRLVVAALVDSESFCVCVCSDVVLLNNTADGAVLVRYQSPVWLPMATVARPRKIAMSGMGTVAQPSCSALG